MTANAPESDPIPAAGTASRRGAAGRARGARAGPGGDAAQGTRRDARLGGPHRGRAPGAGVPALVAGGLILWPKGFGKAERWLRRRFPEAHRKGIGHINRFLTDLERRYPGSTGSGGTGPRLATPRRPRRPAAPLSRPLPTSRLSVSIGAQTCDSPVR